MKAVASRMVTCDMADHLNTTTGGSVSPGSGVSRGTTGGHGGSHHGNRRTSNNSNDKTHTKRLPLKKRLKQRDVENDDDDSIVPPPPAKLRRLVASCWFGRGEHHGAGNPDWREITKHEPSSGPFYYDEFYAIRETIAASAEKKKPAVNGNSSEDQLPPSKIGNSQNKNIAPKLGGKVRQVTTSDDIYGHAKMPSKATCATTGIAEEDLFEEIKRITVNPGEQQEEKQEEQRMEEYDPELSALLNASIPTTPGSLPSVTPSPDLFPQFGPHIPMSTNTTTTTPTPLLARKAPPSTTSIVKHEIATEPPKEIQFWPSNFQVQQPTFRLPRWTTTTTTTATTTPFPVTSGGVPPEIRVRTKDRQRRRPGGSEPSRSAFVPTIRQQHLEL